MAWQAYPAHYDKDRMIDRAGPRGAPRGCCPEGGGSARSMMEPVAGRTGSREGTVFLDPMTGHRRSIPRTIVLVGLMGAGKTSIGRRLADRLRLPFTDADAEIEKAAGCSIADFFERYGEEEFRLGERRVIKRLLEGPVQVLSTGGGAFMHPETRAEIRARAISIWLRADLDTLAARIGRRDDRPLLKAGEPREVLKRLIDERYPVYAEADIIVDSADAPQRVTVERVLEALERHLAEGEAADCRGARA